MQKKCFVNNKNNKKLSRETTVAEGECASIIYQSTPQMQGGMGIKGKKRLSGGKKDKREMDLCYVHQRVSGVYCGSFPQTHLCVLNEIMFKRSSSSGA